MLNRFALLISAFLLLPGCDVTSDVIFDDGPNALVIAHRGASGYLPEHTIAAKAMAYAQGADFIEQDLVMTRDDELVVLHDRFLDTVTNVKEVFPGRSRRDGREDGIDFAL